MKRFFYPALFCFLLSYSYSQEHDLNQVLDYTLSYRGLNRTDITIPVDYFNAGEKSPTNGTQLILSIVRDMLSNPLRSMKWNDSLMSWKDLNLPELILNLFNKVLLNLGENIYTAYDQPAKNIDDFEEHLKEIVSLSNKFNRMLLREFNNDELRFLRKNLFSIFEDSEDDGKASTDIFLFNEKRDAAIKTSQKVVETLSRINMELVFQSGMNKLLLVYSIYDYLSNRNELDDLSGEYIIAGKKIKIGGHDDNIYSGDFFMIIDFGGDDVYNLNKKDIFDDSYTCIFDMSGNDYYSATKDFSLAGNILGTSIIIDKSGHDIYDSKARGNLGASIGGMGLIYDEAGNDTYKSISFSIGAGCFGVGLIVDRDGNDFYIANSYSQGFGMTKGVGCIVDNNGNDSYLVDSRSLDIGRYNDHYVSMCQGFGLGLRPYYAGGIGLIIEGGGNDIYNTDIFGQGGGYWYGLGAILDKSGHDKYNSYQYAQGSGIHIAIGLIKDYDGWDFYSSNGVSQGCGHDFGFGFLWDVKGNDNYSAYSLSQGAGNANGIGILIDESGRDGYLNKEPGNTRGYGNPRREFGSLGIFLDASGKDYYSVAGLDSTIGYSSSWGVSNDYFLADLPEQVSGDNFKVEVDSVNRPHDIPFSTEHYFIMAKTIEPRFSKWQDYGFRKLINDSLQTSAYLLTKLATDDHRDTQVMRVLITKIPIAIADVLKFQLNEYKKGKVQLEPKELSMMCYLMGESKNELFKDDLFALSYYENVRVKSTAVNALGKIKYDTTDYVFIEKVAKRFSEMYTGNENQKILSKDLAFAISNYPCPTSMLTAIQLLNNEYFGARFPASECLKLYKDSLFPSLNDSLILNLSKRETGLYILLTSVVSLKDEYFRIITDKILPSLQTKASKLFLSSILKSKQTSEKNEFQNWLEEQITILGNESLLNKKPAK